MPHVNAQTGVTLDTPQTTAAQNDGAIYDAVNKKWDLTKRSWKLCRQLPQIRASFSIRVSRPRSPTIS